MEICKQQSELEMRHFPVISIYGYVGGRQIYALWALKWACPFFLGQSIGSDETNTFQLKIFSSTKIVGVKGLCGLWALEWAWKTFLDQSIGIDETNTFQLKLFT